MSDGVGFLVFAGLFVVCFLVVSFPLALLINRAIGRSFDRVAEALEPAWRAEGLDFREDDVKTHATWHAPLAVAVRWPTVNVRVTSRGVYLVQSRRMFGLRFGQPIVGLARAGAELDPGVAARVSVATLSGPPRLEADSVVLEGNLGRQRFSWRLYLRDPAGFLSAAPS